MARVPALEVARLLLMAAAKRDYSAYWIARRGLTPHGVQIISLLMCDTLQDLDNLMSCPTAAALERTLPSTPDKKPLTDRMTSAELDPRIEAEHPDLAEYLERLERLERETLAALDRDLDTTANMDRAELQRLLED